jgi:hypothetical protein
MDAKNEQLSLRDEPLPPEETVMQPGDELLPSRILALDRQIKDYEEGLSLAREARKVMIDRAIALMVGEDKEAVILKREKNLPREINAELFEKRYPDAYRSSVVAEEELLSQKIKEFHDNPRIKLKTAQAFLGDKQIDEICYAHKVIVTYEVQSIAAPLPKGQVRKLLE